MQEAEVLIEEIRQITEQYRVEVGSRRKPWPKSIIQRVERLSEFKLTSKLIAERTGIPYFSILKWRKEKKKFHAIAVGPTKSIETATITVPFPNQVRSKVATVTVTTPDGYQICIDGVVPALELLKSLRGR